MVTFRAILYPFRLSLNKLVGKAIVVDYDETAPLQEPISSECFYTRRTYNSLFGSVMVCMIII
jgi:hypothetical protein